MNTTVPDFMINKIWTAKAGSTSPLIIAEIGTSHQGSISRAKEMIDAAGESGAECIKVQHVYADEIIHPRTGMVPLPGGDTALYEVFRSLETGPSFLEEIKEHAEKQGLVFLCTPFGARSLLELIQAGCSVIKIASPELNHIPLLQLIAENRLKTILSTGVSRLSDIEEALETLQGCSTALLHCITSYPAPEEEYNLSLLPHISTLFGIPVGVSDHSMDPLLVPLGALYFGVCCIEKHFTIDRKSGGLDDLVALPPEEFSKMTSAVNYWAVRPKEELYSFLADEFGTERIHNVFGSGKKNLAESEKENYGRSNRSIHAAREIMPGDVLHADTIAVLRTEKELRPGLHPRYIKQLTGRTARRQIPDGEGIRWEDIL
ncbi:N-acetylneuraminate synthase family protein [Marispirochaeta sp.]|jgi:sialic acid synthase SpsE|uniref:N-acetylneuraminate synthase family protein n=1 Tax=Marispirochaeta sp. TaxID=2038653 RepID=UPI0029C82525|nr:N-acetylneuraminate synthase family protein [Marispirochaeta sp.]